MNEYLAMLQARLRTPAPPLAPMPPPAPVPVPVPVPVPKALETPPMPVEGVLALDFETFFDTMAQYTLKKVTMEAYVREPRFAVTCLGYAYFQGDMLVSGFIGGADIPAFLHKNDWANTSIIMHNAHFDGLILSHHYGIHPQFFLDTLSMARVIYPSEPADLETLAAKFGLKSKSVPYARMNGVHPSTMEPALLEEIGAGCAHDCEITLKLFQALREGFPPDELDVIDMTMRMFTSPRLVGRTDDLYALAEKERLRVEQTMAGLGVTRQELRSSPKFRAILEREGVTIGMKKNKKGVSIPAFAKNDDFMLAMLDSGNPRIEGLTAARIAAKNSINETRALLLARTAERGALPVCLKHAGAGRTTRWSGDDKSNWQNFPRTGELGACVEAPAGHVLVIADASQIDCRILNSVAGQDDVVEAFRRGDDVYLDQAAVIYGRAITPADKPERFVGKRTELGAGYGCGPPTLRKAIKAEGLIIPLDLAAKAIDAYRVRHPHVCAMWRDCKSLLFHLARKAERKEWFRGIIVTEGADLILPNGLKLNYDIRYDDVTNNFARNDRESTGIWGGALTGQIIQALAACYFREVLLRIKAKTSLLPVCLRHDEAVYVVPEAEASDAMAAIDAAFQIAPNWLPGIPLKCEVWKSKTYSKAKEF